jgi:hypothetical protein
MSAVELRAYISSAGNVPAQHVRARTEPRSDDVLAKSLMLTISLKRSAERTALIFLPDQRDQPIWDGVTVVIVAHKLRAECALFIENARD